MQDILLIVNNYAMMRRQQLTDLECRDVLKITIVCILYSLIKLIKT